MCWSATAEDYERAPTVCLPAVCSAGGWCRWGWLLSAPSGARSTWPPHPDGSYCSTEAASCRAHGFTQSEVGHLDCNRFWIKFLTCSNPTQASQLGQSRPEGWVFPQPLTCTPDWSNVSIAFNFLTAEFNALHLWTATYCILGTYRFIFKPQEVAEVEISIAKCDSGVTFLEIVPGCPDQTPHLYYR